MLYGIYTLMAARLSPYPEISGYGEAPRVSARGHWYAGGRSRAAGTWAAGAGLPELLRPEPGRRHYGRRPGGRHGPVAGETRPVS